MRKSGFFVVVLVALIISFVSLDFLRNKTIAHYEDLTSSSSSGGQVVLNKNFSGVWKARVVKPIKLNTSSSGSSECVICVQVVPKCLPDQKLILQTCTECAHCTSGGALTNLNTSGQVVLRKTLAHINSGFSGSRIITFKLCIQDGKLEGTVQQTGVIEKGTIISQNIISENEIDVTFKDKHGISANITLKLVGRRKFIGMFTDNHTFQAIKINSLKSCLMQNK